MAITSGIIFGTGTMIALASILFPEVPGFPPVVGGIIAYMIYAWCKLEEKKKS
jgi:hypothetical protein